MKKMLITAGLATLVASPALAQSYDPDLGTGNILENSTTSSGIYLRADDAAAPLGRGNGAWNGNGASTARAAAMRECSEAAKRYLDPTWRSMQSQQYRTCMARHGQSE
jgi:hypothetical protein